MTEDPRKIIVVGSYLRKQLTAEILKLLESAKVEVVVSDLPEYEHEREAVFLLAPEPPAIMEFREAPRRQMYGSKKRRHMMTGVK